MGIKKEDVQKALGDLEENLSKSSEQDLDQPEGDDLDGGHMSNKMSDEAPAPVKGKKGETKKSVTETEEDEMDVNKAMAVLEEAGYTVTEDDDYTEKSFSEGLPEEVQTKIEVSDFLKSLVDHTGDAIGDLREQVAKSNDENVDILKSFAEGLEGIQESQAKIGLVLKAICERIGVVEAAPAHEPKAETDVSKSTQPADRQFESALKGDGQEPMFKSLSSNPIIAKSQMASALCELVKKGDAQDMDVIGFESSGHIRPEVYTKLQTVLN